MMTYLKHVRNKKHLDLNNKTFEDIQALNEKVKRFDESLTAVGSTKDERKIKEMNEGVKDPDQKSLKKRVAIETSKKEDTSKVPAKVDVTEQDGDYLVIYRANGNFKAFNCLLEYKILIDRCISLYDLGDEQYSKITLEGIELFFGGDLKIIMESSQEEND
ncbi:hypothetical protein Tco_0839476 [Tanacetum coccineum]|uniref:Uncharacterized protein n=1 Tax=Tanacetum coccineum TaxID=301880 RepID=A0ABQ5ASK8_9ASTR